MDKIPEFSLPDLQSRPWGSKDLLQRQEMIVVLVGHAGGCERCRRVLEVLHHRQEKDNLSGAAVMAVVPAGAEQAIEGLSLPFAVLKDEQGDVTREIARAAGLPAGEPGIVVADRYGVIEWASPLHAEEPEVLVNDAVASVEYLGLQCPE